MQIAETMSRVKSVIRTCIQLDAETPIADDMPLMEGEYDIDSLDVLLIVSELEREFSVAIEDGDMKRADFVTVESLGAFIESLCAATSEVK